MGKKILIVDDEQSMRDVLGILLKKEGYDVTECNGGVSALRTLQKDVFDLVITDLRMPEVGGIEVLRSAKSVNPSCEVVVITAFGTAESAVEAMKLGAHDYLSKPFQVEDVRRVVKDALKHERADSRPGHEVLKESPAFQRIIGDSPPMKEVNEMLPKLASSEANVMITGESGTGKELAAKAVHYMSSRASGPFVTVNCGAIPENLLESELFGHVKGAFTSAVADKKGLFEIAEGGTLFLDEVGELPLSLQVKLLRVLEDRAFRRVGGIETFRVDVRVISATNKDMKEALIEGSFRKDLYYRLNILPLGLPPLRNRGEDIPMLIEHFMEKMKSPMAISPEAMEVLCRYPWWGNVRELENTMERITVLSDGNAILEKHIPDEIRMPDTMPLPQAIPSGGVSLDGIMADLERRYLLKALEKAGGVKKDAARLLNISFRSFRHRLAKYDLGGNEKDAGQEED